MSPNLLLYLPAAILITSTAIDACTDRFYTAAVFENARQGNWSIDAPKDILRNNLAYFENAAVEAKSKDVDIIIFPEYGIVPFADRQRMKKVVEHVPNPKEVRANPCEQSSDYSNRTILRTLSCIARNNSMVVVANMADIQPCREESGCPEDGVFHFNTNVAFDSDGTLIGRYHKEHLFFENGMDLPKEQQDPTFVTRFGKFAMFVCFDSVFKRISDFAKLDDIEAILLPTEWYDTPPLMTSVQYWQAWAMGNNITFIAANGHWPGDSVIGSGIFHGMDGALVYSFNPDGRSKLIVAQVPKRHLESHTSVIRSSITVITSNGTEIYKNDGDKVPTVCSPKILGVTTDIYTDYRCRDDDISNYTLVKLKGTQDYIGQLCNNGLCCSLNYTASDMQENFYFGVYNGTYNALNRYFWGLENCLLVRCDPFGDNPCATFPMRSNTTFYHVHMWGTFTAEHIYPSVLGSRMRLVSTDTWKYGFQPRNAFVNFNNNTGMQLTVVGLYGRPYDRDPPYIR